MGEKNTDRAWYAYRAAVAQARSRTQRARHGHHGVEPGLQQLAACRQHYVCRPNSAWHRILDEYIDSRLRAAPQHQHASGPREPVRGHGRGAGVCLEAGGLTRQPEATLRVAGSSEDDLHQSAAARRVLDRVHAAASTADDGAHYAQHVLVGCYEGDGWQRRRERGLEPRILA
jgi:hypothetical protein